MGKDEARINARAMAVFEVVRDWHMNLDLTRAKMFDDEECLHLYAWAKQALRCVLVAKTADSMKYRLVLQQARAVTASSFAHRLLQEHRLASDAGLETYTKYWLGPQEQIGEVQTDLAFTAADVEEFDDNLRALLFHIRRRATGRRLQFSRSRSPAWAVGVFR